MPKTMFEMVEAGGVEPPSLAQLPAATTCLVREDFVGCGMAPELESRRLVRMEFSRLPTRGLRRQPCLLLRSSTVAGVQWRTSWRLGRES